MIKKQDIAAPRTVQDMERRYKFGKTFAETMGLAKEASKAAKKAEETVKSLDSEAVFNLLTENGTKGGFFIGNGENGTVEGDIYINAAYIKAGILSGDLIKAGVIQSADGGVKIDLNKGVGNMVALQAEWITEWDDETAGFTKDLTVALKEYLTEEVKKLAETLDQDSGKVKNLAIRIGNFDNSKYPFFADVSLQVFRGQSFVPTAAASFEWWDGKISHMTGMDEYEDGNWVWSDMKWITGDYVVEQGTTGIWKYQKWNSGKIELWTESISHTVSYSTISNYLYLSSFTVTVPLVTSVTYANIQETDWHYAQWTTTTRNSTNQIACRYYSANTNGSGKTYTFMAHVIGTWK